MAFFFFVPLLSLSRFLAAQASGASVHFQRKPRNYQNQNITAQNRATLNASSDSTELIHFSNNVQKWIFISLRNILHTFLAVALVAT
jgi:hypothetical protein